MGKKHDKKKQKSGGLGKAVMLFGLLVVGGVAAAWYMAPEFVQEQLAALRSLTGS